MKEGIKQGYTLDVICSYKFERGQDVFKSYIEDLYYIKKNTTNPVERNMAKMMLNSLYGRFGMKDINSSIKIMSDKQYKDKIDKVYNNTILSELMNGDKLVKTTSKIDDKLRILIKYLEEDSIDMMNSENTLNKLKEFNKTRGVPSAVQIAATISAYAKMSINKFKNLENIQCIYSDTDSVVLDKKLSDDLVGDNIGDMKLEHYIVKGVFPRKKLYALENSKGKVIIKACGADPKKLSYNDILNISKGEDIVTYRKSFRTH